MRHFAFFLLLVSLSLPTADAQKRPVQMQIETMSIRGRSGGAIPVLIKLEHQGNQLLEGDLLLTIYEALQTPSDILATVRYEGIVLQGSDYFMQIILPPLAHSRVGQYLITGWFETVDGDRISLSAEEEDLNEPHEILTPSPSVRTTLVCACSGQADYQKPSANLKYLSRILSLNNYNPNATGVDTASSGNTRQQPQAEVSLRSQLRYYATPWDALNLPENPLHLTCFDVVILADRSLGRLEVSQIEALLTWVDAGGSLCVLPDEQPLKSIHESFLKTLFESADDPSVRMSLSDSGKLEIQSETPDKVIHRRFGLGAVSLLPVAKELEQILTEEGKGQLVGHLWNVRHDSSINEGRPWLSDDVLTVMKRNGYQVEKRGSRWFVRSPDAYGQSPEGSYQSLAEISGVFQLGQDIGPQQNLLTSTANMELMPDGVQMVPPWFIATLLLAYIATIGPLDYWILGLFKARKYTWILFPVVTAVFTGLTIMIAHAYMSSTETGGRLSIVDLVDDGRPVRETILEMNFFGASTTVRNEYKQAFYVPGAMSETQFLGMSNQALPSGGNKPLSFLGRFPQNYRSEVSLSQWDPFLTRTFRLQPKIDRLPEIDWNDQALVTTAKGHQTLATQLNSWDALNDQVGVDAIIMNQAQVFRIPSNRPAMVFDSSIMRRDAMLNQVNMYDRRFNRRSGWQNDTIGIGIIEASVARANNNYFSIVAQIAPQGDASLEDLPIADLTDPDQWLLLVAVKQGNETQVFRKLYRIKSTRPDQPATP